MNKSRLVGVHWGVNESINPDVSPPTPAVIPADVPEEEIANWLSDKYGYLVYDWWFLTDRGDTVRCPDGYERPIIKVTSHGNGGSYALVHDGTGEVIALLNVFTDETGDWFAADIIDSTNRFSKHTAVVFKDGMRQFLEAGKLVAADFRK